MTSHLPRHSPWLPWACLSWFPFFQAQRKRCPCSYEVLGNRVSLSSPETLTHQLTLLSPWPLDPSQHIYNISWMFHGTSHSCCLSLHTSCPSCVLYFSKDDTPRTLVGFPASSVFTPAANQLPNPFHFTFDITGHPYLPLYSHCPDLSFWYQFSLPGALWPDLNRCSWFRHYPSSAPTLHTTFRVSFRNALLTTSCLYFKSFRASHEDKVHIFWQGIQCYSRSPSSPAIWRTWVLDTTCSSGHVTQCPSGLRMLSVLLLSPSICPGNIHSAIDLAQVSPSLDEISLNLPHIILGHFIHASRAPGTGTLASHSRPESIPLMIFAWFYIVSLASNTEAVT